MVSATEYQENDRALGEAVRLARSAGEYGTVCNSPVFATGAIHTATFEESGFGSAPKGGTNRLMHEAIDRWSKETYDAVQKAQTEERDSLKPNAAQKPTKERASIAEQAQRLLKGEERWREIDVAAPQNVENNAALRI